MKMTSREKAMLIFLLVIAILGGSYYLVIMPQQNKIDKMKADQADYWVQVKAVEADLANVAALRKNVDDLLVKIDEETKPYFPSILTEKLLLTLDDLYTQSGLVVNGTVFGTPGAVQQSAAGAPGTGGVPAGQNLSLAQIRDQYQILVPDPSAPKPTPTPKPTTPIDPAQLQTSLASLTGMTVSLQFTAKYEGLTDFIGRMEALKRSVAITSLTCSQMEDGTIAGNMELDIYAIPKITGQTDPYIEWTYTDKYGKPNPFTMLGYDMTVGILPYVAGLPNMTINAPAISKADVLAGTNTAPAEIELIVEKSGTGYACRFRIGTIFYPTGGTNLTPFVPTGTAFRVLVASSLRTGTGDLSGTTLIVRNRTDRPVQVTVTGDDPVRPRIIIGTLEGSVTVR